MANLEDYFGGGVGGVGEFPRLIPSTTYNWPTIETQQTLGGSLADLERIEGFDGDGDTIVLPNGPNGQIQYVDKDGNWSTDGVWNLGVSLGEIHANCDKWVGFRFDGVEAPDDAFQVCAVDQDTIPMTFYFASISQLGVVGNLLSGQIDADFNGTPAWGNPVSTSTASFYRDADGSGNFIIRFQRSASVTDEAQFSSVTGAQVGVKEVIAGPFALYKTAAGNYAGKFQGRLLVGVNLSANSLVDVAINRGDGASAHVGVPMATGAPSGLDGEAVQVLQWKGLIVFSGIGTNIVGVRATAVTDFEAWVDTITEYIFGV